MSAVARNLGLAMRHLFGMGTARGLQANGDLADAFCFALFDVPVVLKRLRFSLTQFSTHHTDQRPPNLAIAAAA